MKLEIFAERGGKSEHAGVIETQPGTGESFTYCDEWLGQADAKPLSLSLPLQGEPFPAKAIRPFFDGLLPEGRARGAIARRLRVSTTAYLKILDAIGRECIGAVSLQGPSTLPEDGYDPFDSARLELFAAQGYSQAAEASQQAHFSLAGSQAKIALYKTPDGEWKEPRGLAPSTHILKPASDAFQGAAANEAICTIAAGKCGIEVPSIEVLDLENPVICVERFDRVAGSAPRHVNGLPVPRRLHQEDLCQAMGVVPEHKYEEERNGYLEHVANTLRDYSTDPLADLMKLWDMTIYGFLIGNCDMHLKNLALLRDATWQELRLAPAYDLLCTTCYEGLSTELAMSIGWARHTEDVTVDSFTVLASQMHLPESRALSRMEALAKAVPDAIAAAALDLSNSGVKCEQIADRILVEVNRNAARLLSL